MRAWILAAVFLAACASAETAPPSGGSSSSSTSTSTASPNYGDARSVATDQEVQVARRAYRSACEQHQSTNYCECMTGGMAQALSPADLSVATAALNGAQSNASSQTRAHVEAVRAQVDAGCSQYRSN